jgi:PhzF family phenazine biosynthesis protein
LGDIQPVVVMKNTPIKVLLEDDTVKMVQQAAAIGATVPRDSLAEALALSKEDLSQGKLDPTMVSTEVNHLMVPLRDIEALDRATADKGKLAGLSAEFGFEGVYCFVLSEEESSYIAQARFFNPGIGITEDPATGSAAGPLAGFLHHKGLIEKDTEYQVLQGGKMGRPSVLKLKVSDAGIVISGSSVMVMEGSLYYDPPN